MKTGSQTHAKGKARKHLIEAVIAYTAFCVVSFLSRFVLPVFLIIVISGLAFPLLWAKLTRGWASIQMRNWSMVCEDYLASQNT